MNRVLHVLTAAALLAIILGSSFGSPQARAQKPFTGPRPAAPPSEQTASGDDNPFAPEPAPSLLPGMTGSDVTDPRAVLTPGLYDAGEAAMGIRHVMLFKKPATFELGTAEPDDPKVKQTLDRLGFSNMSKIPKAVQLVIAQLAFANSDLAFQGNHLFQGNFYGVSIYDISNPAKTTLPAARAMFRSTKTCCSCRSRCRMGVWIAARKAFLRSRPRPPVMKKNVACPPRKRTVFAACGSSISPISRTRNRSQPSRRAADLIRIHW